MHRSVDRSKLEQNFPLVIIKSSDRSQWITTTTTTTTTAEAGIRTMIITRCAQNPRGHMKRIKLTRLALGYRSDEIAGKENRMGKKTDQNW